MTRPQHIRRNNCLIRIKSAGITHNATIKVPPSYDIAGITHNATIKVPPSYDIMKPGKPFGFNLPQFKQGLLDEKKLS